MPAEPVTYERQVPASVYVHLDNGETFAASERDLSRFGYVRRSMVKAMFRDLLSRRLATAGLAPGGDLAGIQVDPVRELLDRCIDYPNLSEGADEVLAKIVVIEQFLAEHKDELAARLEAVVAS